MPGLRARQFTWLDAAILLAVLLLGIAAATWADREYLRRQPPTRFPVRRSVERPQWLWHLQYPFHRLWNDAQSVMGVATLGTAIVLLRDRRIWRRRRLTRPGDVAIAIGVLFGGIAVISQVLTAVPTSSRPQSLAFELGSILQDQVPGSILGAWIALWLARVWRPSPDWRDRLGRILGWCWLGDIGLLIVNALLFG
jgi:hypothetical protein